MPGRFKERFSHFSGVQLDREPTRLASDSGEKILCLSPAQALCALPSYSPLTPTGHRQEEKAAGRTDDLVQKALADLRMVEEEPLSATLKRLGAKRKTLLPPETEDAGHCGGVFAQQQQDMIRRGYLLSPSQVHSSASAPEIDDESKVKQNSSQSRWRPFLLRPTGRTLRKPKRESAQAGQIGVPDGWGGRMIRYSWFPSYPLGPLCSPTSTKERHADGFKALFQPLPGNNLRPDPFQDIDGGATEARKAKRVRFVSFLPTLKTGQLGLPGSEDFELRNLSPPQYIATLTDVDGRLNAEKLDLEIGHDLGASLNKDRKNSLSPDALQVVRLVQSKKRHRQWSYLLFLLLAASLVTVIGLAGGVATLRERLRHEAAKTAQSTPQPSDAQTQPAAVVQSTTAAGNQPGSTLSGPGVVSSPLQTTAVPTTLNSALANSSTTSLNPTQALTVATSSQQPASDSLLPTSSYSNHASLVSQAVGLSG